MNEKVGSSGASVGQRMSILLTGDMLEHRRRRE